MLWFNKFYDEGDPAGSGAKNTDDKGGQKQAGNPGADPNNPDSTNKDDFIPKGRFNDVYGRMKAAETKLAEMDAAEKQRQEDKLKEENKLTELLQAKDKELADTKAKLEEATERGQRQYITQRLTEAATEAGLKKAAHIKLIDFTDIQIDDKTGEPTNLSKVVDAFKKSEPELFKAADDGKGKPNPGIPNPRPPVAPGENKPPAHTGYPIGNVAKNIIAATNKNAAV